MNVNLTSPSLDIPWLRKEVEWVEVEDAKPCHAPDREWHQGSYRWSAKDRSEAYGHPCGSTFCIAGHIAEGDGVKWNDSFDIAADWKFVSDYAQYRLNLDERQAARLFYGDNSAADIRRIAEEIAGERL